MSKKVLGNLKKGLIFVISAPAGTGKSTLVEMLLTEFPDSIAESCSATTRRPRPGEVNEKHYQFISQERFERLIEAGEFIEYASVFGNYYGTRKKEVEDLLSQGKHVLLVIDTQGAMQMKEKVEAIFIFISPPSLDELKKRLIRRQTEDEEMIEHRLSFAKKELNCAKEYNYHIINDNLQITYQIIRSILIAEEHKVRSTKEENGNKKFNKPKTQ